MDVVRVGILKVNLLSGNPTSLAEIFATCNNFGSMEDVIKFLAV